MTLATSREVDAPDRGATRARVEDVTVVVLGGSADADPGVLLDALASQSRLPGRVLVTATDPGADRALAVREHPLSRSHRIPVLVRPSPADPGPGQVLADACGALPVDAGHWIWVLHPDAVPEPGALAALTAIVRRHSRVGVVGPKLVQAQDPRRLLAVGHHLTVAGRGAARSPALVDQGQLDRRQDVLGVPLPGALVRSDVLAAVGGLDPAFDRDGVEGLDLCWRAHLAGHRVVVAPEAVVRMPEPALGVTDPRRTRRRQRQLALARGPVLAGVRRSVGVALTSALAALLLLLVKRPAAAAEEWSDVTAVLAPVRGWAARRRFRSRRSVRPGDLTGLFVPRATGWRSTWDIVGEALDPRTARGATQAAAERGGLESGPVSEDFAGTEERAAHRSGWSWPLALAVLAGTLLTAWSWRDLLGSLRPGASGVQAAELGPAGTDAAGLWRSAVDGWRGGGLGHDQPPESWLVPASVLARVVELSPAAGAATAGVALAWVLFLAPTAAVATAYLALRRATRRRWLRAALGLGWAGAAPLSVAVGQGRVGPVLVHVAAPLLVAGWLACAARGGGPRRTAAAFGTVLLVVLVAQWVPAVLVVGTLAGLLLLVLGRGSARWRGAVLAALPWALAGPWLRSVLADPGLLLGGAGATTAHAAGQVPVHPWEMLLLRPVSAASHGGAGPGDLVIELAGWAVLPLWAAAIAAALLHGRPGRRAVVLVLGAWGALGVGVLLARTVLGTLPAGHREAGLVVGSWPGSLLSLAGAAVLLAAAVLLDRVLGGRPSWPAVLLAAVVAGPAALGFALTAATQAQPGLHLAQDPLPAVAGELARGPGAVRTLVLTPPDEALAGDGGPQPPLVVDLVGAEPEPARIVRDRARDLDVGAPAGDAVVDTVTVLTGTEGPARAAGMMVELGAAYLLLQADENHPLVPGVDAVTGLTRVSSQPGQVLWRTVDGEVGRTRLVDDSGSTLDRIAATGPHGVASGRVVAPDGAGLVAAQPQGWHAWAQVRVDGVPVPTGPDGRAGVPSGDHLVEVGLRTRDVPWHLVTWALLGVIAFLALPVGRTGAGVPRG